MNDLRAHGYSEAELKGAAYNDAFRSLMKFEADRARRYFERGRRLFPLLAAEARVSPMVLHGIYSAVLDRIEQRGFDVFAEPRGAEHSGEARHHGQAVDRLRPASAAATRRAAVGRSVRFAIPSAGARAPMPMALGMASRRGRKRHFGATMWGHYT